MTGLNPDRLAEAFAVVRDALHAHRGTRPYWEGRLSTSPLATATAVSAFLTAGSRVPRPVLPGRALQTLSPPGRGKGEGHGSTPGATPSPSPQPSPWKGEGGDTAGQDPPWHTHVTAGLAWLRDHQNDDGGWGDTTHSRSNIATTMLVLAAFRLAGSAEEGVRPPASKGSDPFLDHLARAEAYVERAGGVQALRDRYGEDRTFAVPILTNCALAGMVDWREVHALPFEAAALPHWTFRLLGLPVVSYALPALIAVGLARFANAPPRCPIRRAIRRLAVGASLRRLTALIPASGGFLEAVPLTAFVVMSLCAAGRANHPAVERGLAFLEALQRPDGGWPIDSDLSVWNTTLAVNALGGGGEAARDWLLAQQQRERHPFTGVAPGGWGWSHRPGSVPDADDTAGALLALTHLPPSDESARAAAAGVRWLLDLQNRDGGWPTFCRGWRRLPFDRSGPDLTAHCLRALRAWRSAGATRRIDRAIRRGLAFLARTQRPDGAWLPLWFGNEDAPDEANPVVGTARVLAAYRDLDRLDDPCAVRGAAWLARVQNEDGSWGGDAGVTGSIEETALACEALLAFDEPEEGVRPLRRRGTVPFSPRRPVEAGFTWLCRAIRDGGMDQPRPIGLYFARLWYAEDLYPLVFAASGLRRACAVSDVRRRRRGEPGGY